MIELKTLLRTAGRLGICYLACLVLFTVLLILSYCIPTRFMHSNMEESIMTLESEGSTWHMIDGGENWRLDNFTLAMMLNTACHGDSDPIRNAFYSPLVGTYTDDYDPIERLSTGLDQPDDGPGRTSYMRYWHGYLVVLKPLLCFLNLTQIRMLLLVVVSALLAITMVALARREGPAIAVLFGISFVAFNYIVGVFSLSFVFCPLLALVGALLVLSKSKSVPMGSSSFFDTWTIPFFVLGALTSYLDFLTFPLITLCIPLSMLVFLSRHNIGKGTMWRSIGWVCALCVCWGLGYATIWTSKWVLATLVTQQNVIEDALHDMHTRTGHKVEGEYIGPLDAPLANLWLAFPFWSVVLWAGAVVATFLPPIRRRLASWLPSKTQGYWWVAPIALIALIPYVWYFFASNHSQIHFWFTYRAQLGTLICIMYVWVGFLATSAQPRAIPARHMSQAQG